MNRDEPELNTTGAIIVLIYCYNSVSFNFKQKITGQTRNVGTKDVQIIVALKYQL